MPRHDASIAPIREKHIGTRQSALKLDGVLPARWLFVGKSGAGKGVALQNLILKHFRGCFARVYCFAPTVHLDGNTYGPIRDYIEKELKHDEAKEGPFFFDEWDEGAVRKIIADQQRLVDVQKKRGHKHAHGVLIVCDDFADRPEVTHANNNVLVSLFLSGRHRFISTFVLTQRARSLAVPLRVNATGVLAWRVSNQAEYLVLEEEASALVDRKTFKEIYDLAVRDQPFSFLFIHANAKTLNETFMVRFEKRIELE